ncbi:hypothetical protein HDV00_007407 [Rhizophlyctis rosea]|nr:hypothetical protein HDV00_007407 [Rhizophlyctis rosea]
MNSTRATQVEPQQQLNSRLQESEAYKSRTNELPFDQRLLEYAELTTFAVDNRLVKNKEITSKNTEHGRTCTTTKVYWKIDSPGDWEEWMGREKDWLLGNEGMVDALDGLREKGWSSVADDLLLLVMMKEHKIPDATPPPPLPHKPAPTKPSSAETAKLGPHDNIVTIPVPSLYDDQALARTKSSASHFLGKRTLGADVYMIDLENNTTGRELRFGFFRYLNATLPSPNLAFGLIITGSDEELEDEHVIERACGLVTAIHDAMESRYELIVIDIPLSRPHARYHKCPCCGGPVFNGPHVNENLRRLYTPKRQLKQG